MPKLIQAVDFFVVGGPVQPDRPCYIERSSDLELLQAIHEQRFCSVLGPRASGKSSLMARAMRTLRAEGYLASVVDLTQIGARGESAEAGRWYYSIAYRIVRELRLKVELQSWWQEKSALMSEQRLAEFFWEVVLTNTTSQIVIFLDDIERASEVPFSHELFSALRGCYTARSTEPDYARLNFVVLGTASPRDLCPDSSISPFDLGRAVEPRDFTLEETYQLAPGFDGDTEHARAVLERIYGWAAGHPYLTQKVSRGVVRRGGRFDDVERTVRDQYLSANALQEEPLLSHVRMLLTEQSPGARQALALLGRIGRGNDVVEERGSLAQQLLRLAGVVTLGRDARLKVRNRIFESVFNSRWVHSAQPFEWRRLTRLAVVVTGILALPIWYTQYLPRPYERTLSVATEDVAVAEDAYQKLHRLPGFAERADSLLAQVIARRSRLAQNYADVEAADTRLRELAGGAALADALLGEYWLRRATAAMHEEERDAALLFASRALAGGAMGAAPLAAELVDDDYTRLAASVRLAAPPAYWEVDWNAQALTVIDSAHRGQRVRLDAPGMEATAFPERLTAVQHVPVVRELAINESGSAGPFALEIVLEHAAPEQLSVTLEAPSGTRAAFGFPRAVRGARYIFNADARSALGALSDEERQGVWRLTLTDRRLGTVGTLRQWGLKFEAEASYTNDAPEQGIAIPDPVRTEQVRLTVAGNGRLGVAQPARAGAVGALGLWDLTTGARGADLQLEGTPDFIGFARRGARLVVVTGPTLTLWDVMTGEPAARLTAQAGFLQPPAISADGEFVAIAEPLEEGSALYSILSSADGGLAASVEAPADVRSWLLGPEARYLALLGPPRVVRIISPRGGTDRVELNHARDVVRMLSVPASEQLLTVDEGGDILAWSWSAAQPEIARFLGTTIDPGSVSLSADGSTLAFAAAPGHVVVRDVAGRREPIDLRLDRADEQVRTRLAPSGDSILTVAGARLQLWSVADLQSIEAPAVAATSLALDPAGDRVAIGFRNGQVQVSTFAALGSAPGSTSPVDYIGHQGAVTCMALAPAGGLVASGGADGVVRLWDLVSAAPRAPFMRHPAGPIREVALSRDGRWLASAAEYSARLWRSSDGELATEVPVNGAAQALAFAPDGAVLAVGDSAGNVFFAAPQGPTPQRSLRLPAAVTALAFAPTGEVLASADGSGAIQLWNPTTATALAEPLVLPQAASWLAFSADGAHLIVHTAQWVHRLSVSETGLATLDSHLLPAGLAASGALLGPAARQLRFVGRSAAGRPRAFALDLAGPAAAPLPQAVVARDWAVLLGVDLDAGGRVVPRLR